MCIFAEELTIIWKLRNFLRIYILPLLMIFGFTIQTNAQQSVPKPDFDAYFRTLYDNALKYNLINDSIFLPTDRKSWVQLFLRRSDRLRVMFKENTNLIRHMEDYVSQDTALIDTAIYHPISRTLYDIVSKQILDPFILEPFINKMLPDYERRGGMDMYYIYNTIAELNFHFAVSADTAGLRIHTKYHKKIIAWKCDNPTLDYYKLKAISYIALLRNQLVQEHIISIDEFYDNYERAIKFNDSIPQEYRNDPVIRSNMAWANIRKDNIVHNYYLYYHPVGTNEKADSIYRDYIVKYEGRPVKSLSRQIFTYLIIKMGMEPQNANKYTLLADSLFNNTYHSRIEQMIAQRILYPGDLVQYLYDLIYMVDTSTLPFQTKHDLMCKYLECAKKVITIIIMNNSQMSYSAVRPLEKFTTYNRVMKYLTTGERIRNLYQLSVTTSVTTFAHSRLVGELSRVILKGVITHHPELLIGTLDIKSEKDAISRADDLDKYIAHAANYHDLGKNSMIGLINNDFARLTDHGYRIIRRHPELGLKYLEIDSTLARYRDITLGHHKWHDGTRGYPRSFDNTKSPVYFLIDIVTLSDCLEAATDRLGRNYSKAKLFDSLISEFEKGAGTRYNADLVDLIKNHSDVYSKMKYIVEKAWINNYYDIYKNFFVEKK